MSEQRIAADFIAEHNSGFEKSLKSDYQALGEQLLRRGIEIDTITDKVAAYYVDVPSWGTGTGGTRFGRFPGGGEPRGIFDKLDGSNLRAEWTPKRGFYKFGSRTQLLTPDQAPLWPAQERLVALEKRLRPSLEKLRTERAVCFFEWAGPNSFAGSHPDALDQMDLFLLDVDVFKMGIRNLVWG